MKTIENTPHVTRHIGQDAEADAAAFVMRLLMGGMTRADCERNIEQRWNNDAYLLHAPGLAVGFNRLVQLLGQERKSSYGADVPEVAFQSKWLVANNGAPGAIYIDAPSERQVSEIQSTGLNRDMHCHDSARAVLITRGEPIFHFIPPKERRDSRRFVIPLKTGDLIFWPKDTPHTFNAMSGFSLLSMMASYIGPDKDGFSYPLSDAGMATTALTPVHIENAAPRTSLCGIDNIRDLRTVS